MKGQEKETFAFTERWSPMEKKMGTVFVYLFIFYSCISMGLFLRDEAIIKRQVNLKNSIENTDLSGIVINNYRVGEKGKNLQNINEMPPELYFEDGTRFYGWYRDKVDYSNKVIEMIEATFIREGVVVKNKGLQLLSSKDVMDSLGEHYAEGLKILEEGDTYTYIDRENDIELVLKREVVYLKRINDQLLRESVAILQFNYDPISVILTGFSRFRTGNIFDSNDYYLLPIYFTFITFPIALLFIVKERRKRSKVIILNLSLCVFYGIMYWYLNIALPLIGV